MSGKLFLICPTDFIEQPIKKRINSDCFFYTALGLNFHWDIDTVKEVLCLINQYSIDHIVFVSDFRNRLYINSLEDDKSLNSYASVLKISETLESVKPQFHYSISIDERMKALASKHLWEQENKLKMMITDNNNYKISALLFDKENDTFLNLSYFSVGFDIQFN
jgi:hypothetical protein